MASISLSTIVLNLASDLTQTLVFRDPRGIPTGINPSPQTPGEDRMYGNGRYRGVNAGKTQQQHPVSIVAAPPDVVATLLAWDNQLLCYRDDWGTKYYGKFRSPQITRHPYDCNADVAFTFTESTYSEAV